MPCGRCASIHSRPEPLTIASSSPQLTCIRNGRQLQHVPTCAADGVWGGRGCVRRAGSATGTSCLGSSRSSASHSTTAGCYWRRAGMPPRPAVWSPCSIWTDFPHSPGTHLGTHCPMRRPSGCKSDGDTERLTICRLGCTGKLGCTASSTIHCPLGLHP